MKKLDKSIEKSIKEWKVPGLSIAVIKDNQVIYSRGFGYGNIKKNLKVKEETIFPIASCTKAFGATALGILVEKGELEWDRSLKYYIPEFRILDDYVSAHMTVRDILCHRTGLARHDLMWYGSEFDRKEIFKRMKFLNSSAGFREKWQYNNLMYMAVSFIIEEITGKKWEDFLKEKILEPLEMNSTFFTFPEMGENFAMPYKEDDGEIIEMPLSSLENLGPAGCLISNISDMAKWVLFNLNKGEAKGRQIISSEILKEIHSPVIFTGEGREYEEFFYKTYGMGWWVNMYRGRIFLHHTGGVDGYSSYTGFMPEDNMGLVILTNKRRAFLRFAIALNIYDQLLGFEKLPWNERMKKGEEKDRAEEEKNKQNKDKKAGTKPSHRLREYGGTFNHPAYGNIKITEKEDKLYINYNKVTAELIHYHYDTFEVEEGNIYENIKLNFLMDRAGEIKKISIDFEESVKDIRFIKKK